MLLKRLSFGMNTGECAFFSPAHVILLNLSVVAQQSREPGGMAGSHVRGRRYTR